MGLRVVVFVMKLLHEVLAPWTRAPSVAGGVQLCSSLSNDAVLISRRVAGAQENEPHVGVNRSATEVGTRRRERSVSLPPSARRGPPSPGERPRGALLETGRQSQVQRVSRFDVRSRLKGAGRRRTGKGR